MRLLPRRAERAELPATVRRGLALPAGDRVLALAVDATTGHHLVASTYAVSVVTGEGALALRRAWMLVDAGTWEPETAMLTLTWADGARPVQWCLRDQRSLLPETVRERVQASVVLSTRLALGDRRSGRVAVRQDLATRELSTQAILGRGVRADDPDVAAQVRFALADLRDQVGLPVRLDVTDP